MREEIGDKGRDQGRILAVGHERQLVRGTRLAPIPVWRDVRRDVYCALVISLVLPFHGRFLRERPEWECSRAPVAETLDLIWTRGASGRRLNDDERQHAAKRLRESAPVDEDEMPLPLQGVAATFALCWILAELMVPDDLETHEVTRAATREARCVVEQGAVRTSGYDWRDWGTGRDGHDRHGRKTQPDPLDHPASRMMEGFLRGAVRRLDGEPLTPRLLLSLRDEGMRTGDAMFRMLSVQKSEDWLSTWGLVVPPGSRFRHAA